GLRASLRFALRPWFQDSHRKWYNYWGQVNSKVYSTTLKKGDVVRIWTAGGGGYGNAKKA
ncbi:MAG: hypothetical protein QF701_03800, partial [Nitrospinota bacterium]|nr:hypothetical protein [Nitrospinota bacterium]